MNQSRHYSRLDNVLIQAEQGMRTLFSPQRKGQRDNPAKTHADSQLNQTQQRDVAGMMRINHTGEVCAQALYQGQALTARDKQLQEKLHQAADEENDHLDWCQARLDELDSRTSYLNPLWYIGSLSIGALAGIAGDKWSLGFLAETEHQVVRHLESHLRRIPKNDDKSRAILEQMRDDENQHATLAINNGAAELPWGFKKLMQATAKLMTKTTYWI